MMSYKEPEDFRYVQTDYKSRTMQLLFDPITQFKTANTFGQQLTGDLKTSGSILYQQANNGEYYKKATNQFIRNFADNSGKLQIFNSVLRQRISSTKQTVRQFTLQQLSDFFPWVMSCQMLFQPMRSLFYCLKNNISPRNFKTVFQQLPAAMINEQVNEAILQSIKYNAPYIQLARSTYQSVQSGYQGRIWSRLQSRFVNLVNGAQYQVTNIVRQPARLFTWGKDLILAAGSKIGDIATKTASYIGGGQPTMQNDLARQFQKQGLNVVDIKDGQGAQLYKQQMLRLFDHIFGQLRVYGDIVINFSYLKRSGYTKVIQNQIYYFFVDQPTLLFSISNSMPSVHFLIQNQLQLIPPQQFNKKFLCGLVSADVLKLGGRLLKQVNIDTTLTQKQKKPMQNFANKYLKNGQKLKTLKQSQFQVLSKGLGVQVPVKKFQYNPQDVQRLANLQRRYAQQNRGGKYLTGTRDQFNKLKSISSQISKLKKKMNSQQSYKNP